MAIANRPEDFATVLGDFSEAALDPAFWAPAVQGLLRLHGGTSGGLMTVDPQTPAPDVLTMTGFAKDASQLYAEHYHRVDLWANHARNSPRLRAVLGQNLVPEAVFERSEVWNDYLRPNAGAFHLLGAVFELGGGRVAALGLHRPRDAEPFDEEDRRQIDRVLPHLQRALQLRARLADETARLSLGTAALEALTLGVVVTDREGVVLLANPAAEALAQASGALSLGAQGRPLAAAHPPETRRLLALVGETAAGGPGGALLLSRPFGIAAVAASVAPLPRRLRDGLPLGAALLVLRDLGGAPPDLAATLTGLFGLTPAEAGLARALLAGRRPEEVAEARGVKLTTVRSQLSQVLHKTGVRRQSELAALLERVASTLTTQAR
jgi:DNA-binding CsgD family transcriptional regulator/PAS domain-containing protein